MHTQRQGEARQETPKATTGVDAKWVTADPPSLLNCVSASKAHPPTCGLHPGMGNLDQEGKELKLNVTANHPHEASA